MRPVLFCSGIAATASVIAFVVAAYAWHFEGAADGEAALGWFVAWLGATGIAIAFSGSLWWVYDGWSRVDATWNRASMYAGFALLVSFSSIGFVAAVFVGCALNGTSPS